MESASFNLDENNPQVLSVEESKDDPGQQILSFGIDTTDDAIDTYIEEIFD